MKKIIFSLFFIVGTNFPSAAQYNVLPQNYDWSKTTLIQDESQTLKNPNTALWISLGSTIVSLGIVSNLLPAENNQGLKLTASVLLLSASPATGYLYTNNRNDFLKNSAIRVGLFVGYLGLTRLILERSVNDVADEGTLGADNIFLSATILAAFGTLFINTTFRDFRRVRSRVHEYNGKLAQSVQILPLIDPVSKVYGAGLRVNF